MELTIIHEDATTITLGWTPLPGAEGYVGTLDGTELLVDGKRHGSLATDLHQIKMGKPQDGLQHQYGVKILGDVGHAAVVSPAPVTPPPTNNINTWEYAEAIAQPRVKNPTVYDVTNAADLDKRLAAIKPGDSIRGHDFTYSGLDIRNKILAGYAEIDLTDNVTIKGKGGSGAALFLGWNQKLHVFGGKVTENMLRIYSLVDCAVMDTWVDHSLEDGCLIFGDKSPLKRCIFRIKTSECSYDWATILKIDPHATKGTGIHAFNLADSNSWMEDCLVVMDIVNQHTGAGCELSNLRRGALSSDGLIPGGNGVEIWLRANGLLFDSPGQTAANGLQFWGGPSMTTDAVKVHYVEVNNALGKVVEAGWADGPFSGVDVEYGRGHNIRHSPAFQPYKGMTYHDCKLV